MFNSVQNCNDGAVTDDEVGNNLLNAVFTTSFQPQVTSSVLEIPSLKNYYKCTFPKCIQMAYDTFQFIFAGIKNG